MDIRCTICGEPWDVDELHDVPGRTYKQAVSAFRSTGCAVFGSTHGMVGDDTADEAAGISAALFDILGDDVDGIAAELADFGF